MPRKPALHSYGDQVALELSIGGLEEFKSQAGSYKQKKHLFPSTAEESSARDPHEHTPTDGRWGPQSKKNTSQPLHIPYMQPQSSSLCAFLSIRNYSC